jgi:hypothetical protein
MIIVAEQEGFKLAVGIYSLEQNLYQVVFIQTTPEHGDRHIEFYLTLEQLTALKTAIVEVI